MIGVQNANLIARVGVPDVNAAVRRAAENELRIGTERRLYGYALVVQVARERLQGSAMEGVDQTDDRAVRADQNRFAVAGEF